jgi:hypothetical protein
MSNRSPKNPQVKRPTPKKLDNKKRISLWSAILGGATLLGYLVLVPRLSVSPSSSLRSSDPMGTVFLLSNDGQLPVHDLKLATYINKIECCNGNGAFHWGNAEMVKPSENPDILLPSHKVPFPIKLLKLEGGGPDLSVEITFNVEFRPDFYPAFLPSWHESFHYATEHDDKGEYVWIPKAN